MGRSRDRTQPARPDGRPAGRPERIARLAQTPSTTATATPGTEKGCLTRHAATIATTPARAPRGSPCRESLPIRAPASCGARCFVLFRILCEPLVKFKIAANHQAQRESASRRSTAMRRIESAGAPHRMRHLMNVIYEKSGASVLEGLHQSAAGERYDGSPGSQGFARGERARLRHQRGNDQTMGG